MIKKIVASLLSMVVFTISFVGCTPEKDTSNQSTFSTNSSTYVENQGSSGEWVEGEYKKPEAFTQVYVSLADADEAATVEVEVENLFTIPAQDMFDSTLYPMENLFLRLATSTNDSGDTVSVATAYSKTGKELWNINLSTGGFSAGRTHFANYDEIAKKILIYNEDGKVEKEIPLDAGFFANIFFSENDKAMAYATQQSVGDIVETTVAVYDFEKDAITMLEEKRTTPFFTIEFSENGKYCAVEGKNEEYTKSIIRIYDIEKNQEVKTLEINDLPAGEISKVGWQQLFFTENALLYNCALGEVASIYLQNDAINTFDIGENAGTIWTAYNPLTQQKREGYIPLPTLEAIAAVNGDQGFYSYYQEKEEYQFVKLTMTNQLAVMPDYKDNITPEMLKQLEGKRLSGNYVYTESQPPLFAELDAVVFEYTANTLDEQLLTSETKDISDIILLSTIFLERKFDPTLGYHEDDPNVSGLTLYYAEAEEMVNRQFNLKEMGLIIDLKDSQYYNAKTNEFNFLNIGGMGNVPCVYGENIIYQEGRLSLDVHVLPNFYYDSEKENYILHMEFSLDESTGRLRYENVIVA